MFPDNRIRELRKKAAMTQADLGRMVGLHQTQIGNIENGARALTFEWARRIASALQVPLADLLGEKDNPYRLTPEEAALISQFRDADSQQRELIQRVAEPISHFSNRRDWKAA